jgi:hypothetical protein
VNVDQMVGLLCLTAIHDIMKVDALLPTVQQKHAPYAGFAAGDRINDHDLALGYILDYYPEVLPSYMQLSPPLRRSIKFTQVKLAFNHGWMVQAEAAPGPLLTSFKKALRTSSGIQVSDVSLYFVHWLTDLAGAEPTPLRGSEKFVLKFPHPVLHSFIASFSQLGHLVELPEVKVVENFLKSKWNENKQSLGPPPTGKDAVALMRLVAQVQHLPLQQRTVSAWTALRQADKEVLSYEMALTGCPDQQYDTHRVKQGGPVFLVYYSPAFMRTAARTDVSSGLRMLADIYRQARSLWPFSEGASLEHVTIRIDQIKEHSPQHIMDGHLWGEGWLLVKRNEREAVIEQHALYTLNQIDQKSIGGSFRVLSFWHGEELQDEVYKISDLQQAHKSVAGSASLSA